jgi:hypothetical protein
MMYEAKYPADEPRLLAMVDRAPGSKRAWFDMYAVLGGVEALCLICHGVIHRQGTTTDDRRRASESLDEHGAHHLMLADMGLGDATAQRKAQKRREDRLVTYGRKGPRHDRDRTLRAYGNIGGRDND